MGEGADYDDFSAYAKMQKTGLAHHCLAKQRDDVITKCFPSEILNKTTTKSSSSSSCLSCCLHLHNEH